METEKTAKLAIVAFVLLVGCLAGGEGLADGGDRAADGNAQFHCPSGRHVLSEPACPHGQARFLDRTNLHNLNTGVAVLPSTTNRVTLSGTNRVITVTAGTFPTDFVCGACLDEARLDDFYVPLYSAFLAIWENYTLVFGPTNPLRISKSTDAGKIIFNKKTYYNADSNGILGCHPDGGNPTSCGYDLRATSHVTVPNRNNQNFCSEFFGGEYDETTRECECPEGHLIRVGAHARCIPQDECSAGDVIEAEGRCGCPAGESRIDFEGSVRCAPACPSGEVHADVDGTVRCVKSLICPAGQTRDLEGNCVNSNACESKGAYPFAVGGTTLTLFAVHSHPRKFCPSEIAGVNTHARLTDSDSPSCGECVPRTDCNQPGYVFYRTPHDDPENFGNRETVTNCGPVSQCESVGGERVVSGFGSANMTCSGECTNLLHQKFDNNTPETIDDFCEAPMESCRGGIINEGTNRCECASPLRLFDNDTSDPADDYCEVPVNCPGHVNTGVNECPFHTNSSPDQDHAGFHCPLDLNGGSEARVHPFADSISCPAGRGRLLAVNSGYLEFVGGRNCGVCYTYSEATSPYDSADLRNQGYGPFAFNGKTYYNLASIVFFPADSSFDWGPDSSNADFCPNRLNGEYDALARECYCPEGSAPNPLHGVCEPCGAGDIYSSPPDPDSNRTGRCVPLSESECPAELRIESEEGYAICGCTGARQRFDNETPSDISDDFCEIPLNCQNHAPNGRNQCPQHVIPTGTGEGFHCPDISETETIHPFGGAACSIDASVPILERRGRLLGREQRLLAAWQKRCGACYTESEARSGINNYISRDSRATSRLNRGLVGTFQFNGRVYHNYDTHNMGREICRDGTAYCYNRRLFYRTNHGFCRDWLGGVWHDDGKECACPSGSAPNLLHGRCESCGTNETYVAPASGSPTGRTGRCECADGFERFEGACVAECADGQRRTPTGECAVAGQCVGGIFAGRDPHLTQLATELSECPAASSAVLTDVDEYDTPPGTEFSPYVCGLCPPLTKDQCEDTGEVRRIAVGGRNVPSSVEWAWYQTSGAPGRNFCGPVSQCELSGGTRAGYVSCSIADGCASGFAERDGKCERILALSECGRDEILDGTMTQCELCPTNETRDGENNRCRLRVAGDCLASQSFEAGTSGGVCRDCPENEVRSEGDVSMCECASPYESFDQGTSDEADDRCELPAACTGTRILVEARNRCEEPASCASNERRTELNGCEACPSGESRSRLDPGLCVQPVQNCTTGRNAGRDPHTNPGNIAGNPCPFGQFDIITKPDGYNTETLICGACSFRDRPCEQKFGSESVGYRFDNGRSYCGPVSQCIASGGYRDGNWNCEGTACRFGHELFRGRCVRSCEGNKIHEGLGECVCPEGLPFDNGGICEERTAPESCPENEIVDSETNRCEACGEGESLFDDGTPNDRSDDFCDFQVSCTPPLLQRSDGCSCPPNSVADGDGGCACETGYEDIAEGVSVMCAPICGPLQRRGSDGSCLEAHECIGSMALNISVGLDPHSEGAAAGCMEEGMYIYTAPEEARCGSCAEAQSAPCAETAAEFSYAHPGSLSVSYCGPASQCELVGGVRPGNRDCANECLERYEEFNGSCVAVCDEGEERSQMTGLCIVPGSVEDCAVAGFNEGENPHADSEDAEYQACLVEGAGYMCSAPNSITCGLCVTVAMGGSSYCSSATSVFEAHAESAGFVSYMQEDLQYFGPMSQCEASGGGRPGNRDCANNCIVGYEEFGGQCEMPLDASSCEASEFVNRETNRCAACESNKVRSAGNAEMCVCPEGLPLDIGGTCQTALDPSTCLANEVVNSMNECASCPSNELRSDGLNRCECPTVSHRRAGEACVPRAAQDCLEDYEFQPAAGGGGSCEICAGGRVSSGGAACACPSGETDVGGVCECSAGSERSRDGSCVSCTGGKVSEAGGVCACPSGQQDFSNGCAVPVACDAGQVRLGDNTCALTCGSNEEESEGQCICADDFERGAGGACVACAANEVSAGGSSCSCPPTHFENLESGVCEERTAESSCGEGEAVNPSTNLCEGCGENAARNSDGSCGCIGEHEDLDADPVALRCVPACRSDEERQEDDACVCPAGEEESEGSCAPRTSASCESWEKFIARNDGGGICIPREAGDCLEGQIFEVLEEGGICMDSAAPPTDGGDSAGDGDSAGGGNAGGGGDSGGGSGAAGAIALMAVPVALLGGYAMFGGFEHLDSNYQFDYSGENENLAWNARGSFVLEHGGLSSYASALQSSGGAVSYAVGTSYENEFLDLAYDARESGSEYWYDLDAKVKAEFGMWTIAPSASAEFRYRREEDEWDADSAAGLTAAWSAHRWEVRARSNFTDARTHALDLELRF